jgi:outer membrane protein
MKRAFILISALPAVLGAQIDSATGARIVSLPAALDLAHRNSPQVQSAQGAIRTAEGSVRTSRAAFLPQLSISVSQSKGGGQSRNPVTGKIESFTERPWGYSNSFGISLPPVFDGGRTLNNLRAARSAVGQAEANEVNARSSVSLSVKQQYNAILSAREQETAARLQLGQARQSHVFAKARVLAGAAIVVDSLTSFAGVLQAELAILQAQNSLRNANAQLTRLVGSDVSVTANPADTAGTGLTPVDSGYVMGLALQGPTIKAQEAAVATAELRLRAAKAPYYPTVTANVSYSGSGRDQLYGLRPGTFAYGYGYGFGASYQIFDRFARSEAKTSAQISISNAEATLRDQRLTAQANMINYLGLIRVAEQQMRIGQIQLIAAEEALRVQQARYENGLTTLTELLPAQTQVNSARTAIISARLAYRNAKAQIESIIGRDLP